MTIVNRSPHIQSLCRFIFSHLLIILIGILVLAAGWWWNGREQFIPQGSQQTVETVIPKAGVHTRLENEVEPAKIKQSLEMVREMGAPWIVEYFPWAFSEPRKGDYKFEHADLVVDHANRQGITVIARLGLVPDWAKPEDTVSTYLDHERFPDFAAYAATFAEHFQGRVDHIIIWNEPNLSLEWGYRPVDPDSYVELLCQSAKAIRAINPEITILAGALAPTIGDPTGELGMADLDFLQAMYDAGAAPCFDALAAHSYGLTFPPDDPLTPKWSTSAESNYSVRSWKPTEMATSRSISRKPAGTTIPAGPERCARPSVSATPSAHTNWRRSGPGWKHWRSGPSAIPGLSAISATITPSSTPDFEPKPIYLEVKEALTE